MLSYAALCRRSGAKSLGQTLIVLNLAKASHSRKIAALRDFDPADVALGHSRHSRYPGVSRSPPKADIRPVLAFMSTRPNSLERTQIACGPRSLFFSCCLQGERILRARE